jgi:hypothetical protein
MAKFYAKERSKIGSLSGTIIVWPIKLSSNDPNNDDNKSKLPAGYLKCDGSKYNAVAYPELAEICGTGLNCKFVRKDLNGDPLTTLTDSEFVVPDLGSKYPRPVPGSDAGTYNAINVKTRAGVEKRRSGMGIDATSTVGSSTKVTYTGKFVIPIQTISLTGKPAWTKGTNNLGYTDTSTVESSGIFPHMHFSTTNRCRIKPTNILSSGQDPGAGPCYYKNASTINISNWLAATTIQGASPTAPEGSRQPPCWAIASNNATGRISNPATASALGSEALSTTYYIFFNVCQTLISDFRYSCLLRQNTKYYIAEDSYSLGSSAAGAKYSSSTKVPLLVTYICIKDQNVKWSAANNGSDTNQPGKMSPPIVNTYLYTQGATGVPSDWVGNSLYDVLPLNSNSESSDLKSYPQVANVITETEDIVQTDGDPTNHNHKITLDRGDHNFKVQTDAFLLSPDALNTQLTISTDTAASLDSVSAPYIILEYLIKI